MIRLSSLLLTSLLTLSGAAISIAQTDSTQPVYQEYTRPTLTRDYISLCRTATAFGIVVHTPSGPQNQTYPRETVRERNGAIYAGEKLLFDSAGLHFGDSVYALDRISAARVTTARDSICVDFSTRTDTVPDITRIRRGNRIGNSRAMVVPENDFVRGMIFTTTGRIDVLGEVGKDVISILGDIHIGEGAKVRGDAVSLFGRVDIKPEASVYGEVVSSQDRKSRRHSLVIRQKEFEIYPRFIYNRVDGATPLIAAGFNDTDSTLPRLHLEIGYAFASERLRWKALAEQTLLRHPAVTVGGTYGHWLASEDDWMIDDAENSAFALLVTEDFRDYYETTSGEIFFRSRPIPRLSGELAFRYDAANWLDAHRNLWSLFGGGKVFRENWSTVDSSFRRSSIPEIDTGTNAVIRLTAIYDSRYAKAPFDSSAWAVEAQAEWSVKDFDSNWDYSRYTLSARRYQVVSRYTTLLMAGRYGNSDGYLPMFKRFFLGGLGTLHGYDHKEYMGTRFWMTSAEYRVRFRHAGLALSLLWDVGQIANDTKFHDAEVKHSIGVAAYIEDSFRISLARRLDRSDNADPKIYVRFQHEF